MLNICCQHVHCNCSLQRNHHNFGHFPVFGHKYITLQGCGYINKARFVLADTLPVPLLTNQAHFANSSLSSQDKPILTSIYVANLWNVKSESNSFCKQTDKQTNKQTIPPCHRKTSWSAHFYPDLCRFSFQRTKSWSLKSSSCGVQYR